MPHHIDANYNQIDMFPPCPEDWVPADHPARFIRAFVNELDLSTFSFSESPCKRGRPRYSNKLLLRVWLYGRMHKLNSSRDLESGCYRDVGLIWLTGQNYPDHNTIWRFYKNNTEALKSILKQFVAIAVRGNLVGFVVQALDGTKIEALVSKGKGCSKTILKRLLSNLDEIVEEISVTEQDDFTGDHPYSMPESLTDPQKLNELIHSLMKAQKRKDKLALDEGVSKTAVKNKLEEIITSDGGLNHPTDPDARVMNCGGKKVFGYNAEAIVDDKHGLIVGASVTQENNDIHQLSPLIEQTIENTGEKAEVTLADAGYCSGEELHKVAELEAEVLVNDPSEKQAKANPFHINHFTFDKQDDVYICPLGEKLTYRGMRKGNGEAMDRVYVCKNLACPKKNECTRGKGGRSIRRSGYIDALSNNRENLKKTKNKELLSRRKTIVEPIFGQIKQNEGFRRWSHRGVTKVKAEWSIICITHNIKKMYRLWQSGLFRFPSEGQTRAEIA